MTQHNLLKNRDFVKLLIAQGVSDFGDGVAFLGFIMIALYVYSGGAFETSIIFISLSLPVILVGPFAGVFVDRWNRKHAMIASDVLRAIAVCILLVVSTLWSIYIVCFVISTLSRFFYPSRGAIIPNIVGKENVLRANAMSQSVMYAMNVISPSASGLLIAMFGVQSVFLIDAASYLFSAVMVMSLKYTEKPGNHLPASVNTVVKGMRGGMRILLRTPPVKYIIISFSVIMLFAGAVNVLYLLFVRDVMHLNIVWVGYLETIFGIGAVMGGVVITSLPKTTKNADLLVAGTFSGALIALLALFPHLYIIVPGFFFVGFFMVFINTPPAAIVQKTIPDRARGRVLSVMNATFQTMSLVSMLTVSAILAFVDIVSLFIFGGCMLFVLGLILFERKKVREMLG
ncbi:MAG: MFS transporter [Thermoplasmata archaeon]|nr:MFS transporter [Thermoplasmata archaeon]